MRPSSPPLAPFPCATLISLGSTILEVDTSPFVVCPKLLFYLFDIYILALFPTAPCPETAGVARLFPPFSPVFGMPWIFPGRFSVSPSYNPFSVFSENLRPSFFAPNTISFASNRIYSHTYRRCCRSNDPTPNVCRSFD